MSNDVISSYLVKLGYSVDTPGFQKFQGQLREASALVSGRGGEIAKSFLTWQTATVSAFAAMGTAALGLADKVAMADQEYRLFGMRMYMTGQQAKTLKIAMDALGQPLESIAWDPELRGRFNRLVEDQKRLQESFGPDFEMQMRKIRDIRFEFTRLSVTAQYFGMKVIEDFMHALGLGPDDLLVKLRKLDDWIITNLPFMSQQVAKWLMPVWKDVKTVLSDTLDASEDLGLAFTNIVAVISGDTSISGAIPQWENFAIAIQHVANGMGTVVGSMTDIIGLGASTASAVGLVAQGKGSDAANVESQGIHKYLNARTLGALGLVGLGVGASFLVGPEAAVGGVEAAEALEGGEALEAAGGLTSLSRGIGSVGAWMREHWLITGATGALLGQKFFGGNSAGSGSGSDSSTASIRASIISTALRMGVDPRLALAVAKTESDFRQYDANGGILRPNDPNSHAMGIFQLQPGTARQMGVDPTNPLGNIQGGVGYLRDLINQYGSPRTALEHYYGSSNMGANADYANRVMSIESGINIGSLTVTVPSGDPAKVRRSVMDGINDARQKQVQRNLAEFSDMSFSYGGG